MDQVLILIGALFAGAGGSLITGLVTRPKTNAEARQGNAGAEVSLSSDARAWAEEFRAEAADARMVAAAAEAKVDAAIGYIHELRRELVALGGHPPTPPSLLIPPLPPSADVPR